MNIKHARESEEYARSTFLLVLALIFVAQILFGLRTGLTESNAELSAELSACREGASADATETSADLECSP